MNTPFDSLDEKYIFDWLKELQDKGVITNLKRASTVEIIPDLYFDKEKEYSRIVYTPDFEFTTKNDFLEGLFKKTATQKSFLIDVKSKTTFKKNNNSDLTFPIKARLMYMKGLYVNKVNFIDLFYSTFVPKTQYNFFRNTKNKIYKSLNNCIDVQTYLDNNL